MDRSSSAQIPALLLHQLYAMAHRPGWRVQLRRARRQFFGLLRLNDLPPNEREERWLTFLEWFLFDRPLPRGGGPPVLHFARRHPSLPERERRRVAAWANSLYSSFEVSRRDQDGLWVRDLHDGTDRHYRVADRGAAAGLQTGEVVTGRLLYWAQACLFSAVPLERWPAERARALPALLQDMRQVRLTPLLRERLHQSLEPPSRNRREQIDARRLPPTHGPFKD